MKTEEIIGTEWETVDQIAVREKCSVEEVTKVAARLLKACQLEARSAELGGVKTVEIRRRFLN